MTDVLEYLKAESATQYAKAPVQEFDTVRFQVEKQVLLTLLDRVSWVVPQKTDRAVLKNFYVEVSQDTLKITGSDDIHTIIVATKMFEPIAQGSMLLPAKTMLDILRSAPDAMVDIEVIGKSIIIVIGPVSWELKSLEGLTYPATPNMSKAVPSVVDRQKFLDAMLAVKYAVAKDSARPGLKIIEVRENKMTACDGIRFQRADIDAPPMHIPGGSIDLIAKFLGSSASAQLVVTEVLDKLVFKVDKMMLLVKVPSVKFPHAEQLFLRPALSNDEPLEVNRAELIEAIRQVRICADEDTSAIALKLTKNAMEVYTRDQEGRKASRPLGVLWKGKTRTVVVHHRYLLELLSVNEVETCKFMLGEDSQSRKSPLLLKNDEAGLVGVVQQMFLGSLTGYTL